MTRSGARSRTGRTRSYRWRLLARLPRQATAVGLAQTRARRGADIRADVRHRVAEAVAGADVAGLSVTAGSVVVGRVGRHFPMDDSLTRTYHDLLAAARGVAEDLRAEGRAVEVREATRAAETPDGGRPEYQVHEVVLHIGAAGSR
jgi:hypothetical protein